MSRYLVVAGLLGATGVAAGAFGAHALEASVSPERIAIWETAAQYHLMHAAVIWRWRYIPKRMRAGGACL